MKMGIHWAEISGISLNRLLFGSPAVLSGTRSFASPDCSGFAIVGEGNN